MARYRKIDVRIWNDGTFAEFTDDAKLLFLFLLTHPNLTSLGAMRATKAGLAEELQWSLAKFARAFGVIVDTRRARFDKAAAFLWLPNFLRYNPAENGNVVKGWVKSLDLLPECTLRADMLAAARAHCEASDINGVTEAFREVFGQPSPKPFGGRSPNRRGNQEQEQETDHRTDQGDETTEVLRGSTPAPVARLVSSSSTAGGLGPEHLACQELAAAWNRIRTAPAVVFADLLPESKRTLRTALRAKSLDTWERIFERIAASDYLAGRGDLPAVSLFRAIELGDRIDAGQFDNRTETRQTEKPAPRGKWDIDIEASVAEQRARAAERGRAS